LTARVALHEERDDAALRADRQERFTREGVAQHG
jgi:hypothetical protein